MKKILPASCGHTTNSISEKIMVVMRKSLFASIFFLNLSIFAFSQKVSIDVESKPISEVLKLITQQTGVDFFYSSDLFNSDKIISIQEADIDISELLPKIIGKGFKSAFVDQNLITIKPRFEEIAQTQQEAYTVTGTVSDEFGNTISGATVEVLHKKQWDITRDQGKYRVTALASDTLMFSYLGFKKLSIPVAGRRVINVTLTEDIEQLGAVTVNAPESNGYTKIPKERSTGSFASVSSEEIQKVPTIDLNERLEGKIPGVNVNPRTGNIEIRGTNSYSLTPPLIVIDGFPMSTEEFSFTKSRANPGYAILSYLNPDDIESLTVLKDAAATAIWGSRAANGVIVIETKRGKKSTPVVSISSTVTFSDKISLDKLREMNSAQYVDLELEMLEKGYIADNSSNWQAANPSALQTAYFQEKRGEISLEERDAIIAELASRDNSSQIKNYLLQNKVMQQYDFSVSGGGTYNTYYASLGYNEDQGAMKSNSSKSYNVTLNNSFDIKEYLKLETGVNYVKSKYNLNTTSNEALSIASNSSLRPYDLLADENGNGIDRYLKFTPAVIDELTGKGYLPWTYNYLDELNYNNNVTNGNALRFTAKLTAKLTNWLSVSASGRYNKIRDEVEQLNQLESYFTRNLINEATSYTQADGLVYGIPLGAYRYSSYDVTEDQALRLQATVDKVFKGQHNLNLLVGLETREEKNENAARNVYGYDLDSNTFKAVNPTEYYTTVYGWQTFIGSSNNSINKYLNRYASYYSLGSYSFKNKYHVSGSLRLDDYNLLGASSRNRIMPLWSTGLKWDISRENFLKNTDWLSILSLRATYGKTGSTPPGGLGNIYPIINASTDYNTQLPTASISTPENAELKWETTKSWNFGLDYGLLNGRISGNVDVYFKKSSDILTNVPFNPTYGFSFLTYNTGSLKGSGVDLGITGIILNGDLSWSSTFNFGYNTNEVTDSRFEVTTTNQYFSSAPILNKPLTSIYAYNWAGLDEKGQSQIYNASGDLITSDQSSMDINPEDLVYMGTTRAPYSGGFFNSFSYKNWSLNIQMTYYMGHVFRNQVLTNYPSFSGLHYGPVSREAIVAERWRNPGDENITNIPGLSDLNFNSINRFKNASINVLPADHIRLQQIGLGYNLPASFFENSFFKSASINLAVRNLGILWRANDQKIDPLYRSINNYSTLPPERNYTFSASISF